MIRAVCLMGPTASGKTDLALALARQFPFDIISVDSAQVYRRMDIGTAKPSPEILRATPHRLIDIREPWESYSAGAFCEDATIAMQAIVQAGRVPLLVGGTMLYFQALQRGIAELPSADPALRAELDQRAEREGWPALHAELSVLDPDTAARLKPTDSQRIQRALEVCLLSGSSMTEMHEATRPPVIADYLNIGLVPGERRILHQRIEQRFLRMLEAGLVAEVRMLSQLPQMSGSVPAMRAVGYRQIWEYVCGTISYEEAVRRGTAATRQLAKRQITWLRSWPELHVFDCFDADSAGQIEKLIATWLADGASSNISR